MKSNDNDTNKNTPSNIPSTPDNPENKVDIKAIQKTHQRRVLRKHFKSFISFMDQHVDYYLLNMSNAIATNESQNPGHTTDHGSLNSTTNNAAKTTWETATILFSHKESVTTAIINSVRCAGIPKPANAT